MLDSYPSLPRSDKGLAIKECFPHAVTKTVFWIHCWVKASHCRSGPPQLQLVLLFLQAHFAIVMSCFGSAMWFWNKYPNFLHMLLMKFTEKIWCRQAWCLKKKPIQKPFRCTSDVPSLSASGNLSVWTSHGLFTSYSNQKTKVSPV